MTEFIFKNNAEGELLNDIGGGSSDFDLESGQGSLFPSPTGDQAFYILVKGGGNQAWMLCTERSSDNFSVTRIDSYSFPAGSTVKLAINATILASFIQKGTEREYAGNPDGVLAANYSGEEILDSINLVWYKHITGTTWKLMNGEG